jgi:hypothetical protein
MYASVNIQTILWLEAGNYFNFRLTFTDGVVANPVTPRSTRLPQLSRHESVPRQTLVDDTSLTERLLVLVPRRVGDIRRWRTLHFYIQH